MRRIRDKKVLILIGYSIITFIIFIIGAKFITNIFDANGRYSLIGMQDSTMVIDKPMDDYKTVVDGGYIIPDVEIEDSVKGKLDSKFNMATIIFFIFIVISNFLLLIILNRLELKERLEIANNIKNIKDEEEILSLDPIMSKVYKELKDKFDSHIEDYKRLNSYLTHEQKNAIAILRTSLEINKDQELLLTLDKVSDSVEDVLAISDVNNNDDMHEIDIALICAQVCDNYTKIYKKLSFDFDEDDNTSIYGKEKWIYRGISNLLDNAIKYGDGKEIHVNVKNKKGSVVISVEDNGIGINKSNMKKIFYDRFRINELNKDGYGIGLSLVKHVCTLCDGFVWVESEEDKGSTFYLAFKEYKE
ncbi:sensor histidine kinase [Romboutsia weinsteinii]|uniref:histidine kinase n=1 Tax=Romboutsia weinsteinii TaxID=2020949 RepID=A0A255I7W1_9FIRM|nr:HAMP domain-containing sensor histidine kinase [Romboutsia weinsteinii]RDY25089.1 sensor histidine kinase [Romboutsia weinsteinii]